MESNAASVSSSRKRRLRAIATRQKLWTRQHMTNSDDYLSKCDNIMHVLHEVHLALLNSTVYFPMYVPYDTVSEYAEVDKPLLHRSGDQAIVPSQLATRTDIDETTDALSPAANISTEAASEVLVLSPADDGNITVDCSMASQDCDLDEKDCVMLNGSGSGEDDYAEDWRATIAATEDAATKLHLMAEQLASEASDIHSFVVDNKSLFSYDAHRILLAHSAALTGKARKIRTLSCDSQAAFFTRADDFIDSRCDFFRKLKEIVESMQACEDDLDSTSAKSRLLQSSIATLSQRIWQHQRTRVPRPTTKTKRPKAHHRRGK